MTCRARGGLLGRMRLFSICRNGGLRPNGGDCTIDFLLRSRDTALGSGRVSGVVSGLVTGLRGGLNTGLEWWWGWPLWGCGPVKETFRCEGTAGLGE